MKGDDCLSRTKEFSGLKNEIKRRPVKVSRNKLLGVKLEQNKNDPGLQII